MITPYYADPAVTLYCADYRAVIPDLDVADHVITDPPYSEYTHGHAKSNRDQRVGHGAINFTAIDHSDVAALLGVLAPVCRRWFIATLDWRHIAQLERDTPAAWDFIRFGVWVKTNPMPQISADRPAHGWDGIAYLHKRAQLKRWNGGGDHGNWIGPVVTNGDHPTGKPEGMLQHFIAQHSEPGEVILDPFAGSGTTLIAAKRLGRRAIGIELDPKYCAVAARRLQQEALNLTPPPGPLYQPDLFEVA